MSEEDWLAALNDAQRTAVEKNGWGSPADVIDNFKSLESHVGIPKDQILRMPQKDEDWGEFYTKLGRPEKPEDYTYETPEGGDADFVTWAKSAMHEIGLSDTQAKNLFESYAAMSAERQEREAGRVEDLLTEQQQSLKKNWGSAYDQNMGAAKTGARALGLEETVIDALQKQIGFDGVMMAMESVGRKVGEAQFHGGGGGVNEDRLLAPDVAQRRITELRGDTVFMDKFTSGDPASRAKMESLYEQAYPEQQTG